MSEERKESIGCIGETVYVLYLVGAVITYAYFPFNFPRIPQTYGEWVMDFVCKSIASLGWPIAWLIHLGNKPL